MTLSRRAIRTTISANLDRNSYPWLSDRRDNHFFLGNCDLLKRNDMPDDQRRDARGHNVLMTVHGDAEWDRDDQVGQTRWITQRNRLYGFPNASVAHAWFYAPNSEQVLAAAASFPLVKGIRSKPVTSLSPRSTTPGARGTMQVDAWLRGFACLGRPASRGTCACHIGALWGAAEVAHAFPRAAIVLNHTGFAWDRSAEGPSSCRRAMVVIARRTCT
jgi:predicted TIM-barrel fold metal-dependent hydrolase